MHAASEPFYWLRDIICMRTKGVSDNTHHLVVAKTMPPKDFDLRSKRK